MNQIRLIKAAINKYESLPEVQADIKKVVRYCESYTRYGLRSVFSTTIEEEIEQITDSYNDEDEEAEKAFKHTVLCIRGSLTGDKEAIDRLKNIISSLAHRPELQKDLIAVSKLIASDLEPALIAAIKAAR